MDEWAGAVRVVPGRAGIFSGRLMRAGFIYAVATLGEPVSAAHDPEGNLVIADDRSPRVRVVATDQAGDVLIIAGSVSR